MSSHMYPENPEGTQVIVGSMKMGYISDTARNRTHNLFCSTRESIPPGMGPKPSWSRPRPRPRPELPRPRRLPNCPRRDRDETLECPRRDRDETFFWSRLYRDTWLINAWYMHFTLHVSQKRIPRLGWKKQVNKQSLIKGIVRWLCFH